MNLKILKNNDNVINYEYTFFVNVNIKDKNLYFNEKKKSKTN